MESNNDSIKSRVHRDNLRITDKTLVLNVSIVQWNLCIRIVKTKNERYMYVGIKLTLVRSLTFPPAGATISTSWRCPREQAHMRGVQPSLERACRLDPREISRRERLKWPSRQASWRAVCPLCEREVLMRHMMLRKNIVHCMYNQDHFFKEVTYVTLTYQICEHHNSLAHTSRPFGSSKDGTHNVELLL